jgi:hypothetical protein
LLKATRKVKFMVKQIIPVTGSGDPEGCETSRLLNFIENQLTDGGEVLLKRRSAAV